MNIYCLIFLSFGVSSEKQNKNIIYWHTLCNIVYASFGYYVCVPVRCSVNQTTITTTEHLLIRKEMEKKLKTRPKKHATVYYVLSVICHVLQFKCTFVGRFNLTFVWN